MSKTEDHPIGFVAAEEEILERYKPLSRLAVLAAICGAVSFLALFHPLLWLLPTGALVLSLLAIWVVSRPEQELSGASLARIGLVLALFFGAWAPSRYLSARHWIGAQARRHSDHWIDLIRKRNVRPRNLYEAYELHLPYFKRQAPGTNLIAYYGELPELPEAADMSSSGLDRDPKARFRSFWLRSPQLELLAFGGQAGSTLQFDGYAEINSMFVADMGYTEDTVVVAYRFGYPQGGQQKTMRLGVVMVRRWSDVSKQHWFVEDVVKLEQ